MDEPGAGRIPGWGPPPIPPGAGNPCGIPLGAPPCCAIGGRLPIGAGMPGAAPGGAPKPAGTPLAPGMAGPGMDCPGGIPLGLGAGAPSGASDFFPSRALRSILPAAMCFSAPLVSLCVVWVGYHFAACSRCVALRGVWSRQKPQVADRRLPEVIQATRKRRPAVRRRRGHSAAPQLQCDAYRPFSTRRSRGSSRHQPAFQPTGGRWRKINKCKGLARSRNTGPARPEPQGVLVTRKTQLDGEPLLTHLGLRVSFDEGTARGEVYAPTEVRVPAQKLVEVDINRLSGLSSSFRHVG